MWLHNLSALLVFLSLSCGVATTSTSVAYVPERDISSSTIAFPEPSGYSTKTYAAPTLFTSARANDDFSDEALGLLWAMVGPVSTGAITTTASVNAAESTSLAQPGIFHPLVPSYDANLSDVKLPAHFSWGVAASSYQIEGAARDEGKGPSIWDFLAHRVPGLVADNSTGDVVAQHYYLYRQDIARMATLGIPRFSPSISWPRLFPFGKGPVNEAGVRHYDDVFRTMVEYGVRPSVTLFHWDTPLALFLEYGAWADRRIVDDFVAYAKFVIERYDGYVENWFTVNEPQWCDWQFSLYPAGQYYPAFNNLTGGLPSRFACGHYTLLAHATVAKWYHEEFKGKGRITFKNSGNYFEVNTTSDADRQAQQRQFDFVLGWFGGPWTDGDYPDTLKDTLGDVLPSFTDEEKALIKGSCDFFAIDGYTSYIAYAIPDFEACLSNASHPDYPVCAGSTSVDGHTGFPLGPAADPGVSWLASTPGGIRRFLKHITTVLFPTVPDVMVTEFGFAEPFETELVEQVGLQPALWDLRRADYLQSFLDSILEAFHYDGVNVSGAWAWAWVDNFEWFEGSRTRFGLQFVNYTDLSRTPKPSLWQFLKWFGEHGG